MRILHVLTLNGLVSFCHAAGLVRGSLIFRAGLHRKCNPKVTTRKLSNETEGINIGKALIRALHCLQCCI